MYTIKQITELTGVSGYTLRFYDKEGLFPNLARDGVGRRAFSDADLLSLRTIMALRDMGLSIAQIREFVEAGRGAGTLAKRGEIIAEGIERAKAELEEAKRRIALLSRAASYYEAALTQSGGACGTAQAATMAA